MRVSAFIQISSMPVLPRVGLGQTSHVVTVASRALWLPQGPFRSASWCLFRAFSPVSSPQWSQRAAGGVDSIACLTLVLRDTALEASRPILCLTGP